MKQLIEYIYPNSLQETLSLISDEKTMIIAGGTQLVPARYQSIKRLVDIRHIGLNYIGQDKNEIHIGCTTTITDMIESSIIQNLGKGVLTKVCLLIGDNPLRNVITVGGNIAKPMPWVGLPVALIILKAEIVIVNHKNISKIIPSHEYFDIGGIQQGELIKKVVIPLDNHLYCKYEKFSLTTVDYSWLTLGFSTHIDKGKIIDPCVAVSRISKPQRLTKIEKLLDNQNINDLDLDGILSVLPESVTILSDYRSTKEYRAQLLKTLFKKMLIDLQTEFGD